MILHSRSPSRYIEFQTWILSRAREGERGRGGGVELTPSPVNPKVESRKLVNRHPSISRARFLLFDARFAFHGLHPPPLARRKSPERHAFFAPRRRAFISACLEGSRPPNFRFRPMEIRMERIGRGGRKNETRGERSKLMDSPGRDEENRIFALLCRVVGRRQRKEREFRGVRLIYWLAMCLSSRGTSSLIELTSLCPI